MLIGEELVHAAMEDEPAGFAVGFHVPTEGCDGPGRVMDGRLGRQLS